MIYGLKALGILEEINIKMEILIDEKIYSIIKEDAVSKDINIRRKDKPKVNINLYVGNDEAASRNGIGAIGKHAGRIKITGDNDKDYVVRIGYNKDELYIKYGVHDKLTKEEESFFRSKKGKLAKEFIEDNSEELANIYYMDNKKDIFDSLNKLIKKGKYEFTTFRGKKIDILEASDV